MSARWCFTAGDPRCADDILFIAAAIAELSVLCAVRGLGVSAGIAIAAALTGFFMLACLPVMLEIAERRAGPAGTSATALIWLAGNAGDIVIALVVQTAVHHPLVGFLLMAVIAAGVLTVVSREDHSKLLDAVSAR